jgi:hypothetical protein
MQSTGAYHALKNSGQSFPLQRDFSTPTNEFHDELTEQAIWCASICEMWKFEGSSFSILWPNLQ